MSSLTSRYQTAETENLFNTTFFPFIGACLFNVPFKIS